MKTNPSPSRALVALSGLAALRHWTPEQLAPLASDADLLDVEGGRVIDRAGTYAHQVVGIVEGRVLGVGLEGDVVVLGPGVCLGADELVEDRPHTLTYTTATTATLVVVFGPAFEHAARHAPPLAPVQRGVHLVPPSHRRGPAPAAPGRERDELVGTGGSVR